MIFQKEKRCYLCEKEGRWNMANLHRHHIFDGPRRKISEREGFCCYLCIYHHTAGPAAVHNNRKNMEIIQQDCQRMYEKTHTRQEWMQLIGKNYL